MKKYQALLAAIAVSVFLAGCSSSPEPTTPATTPQAVPAAQTGTIEKADPAKKAEPVAAAESDADEEIIPEPEPVSIQLFDGAKFSTSNRARELLNDYLAQKGWSTGFSNIGKTNVIITTAVAPIAAPATDVEYVSSRQSAFTTAMLDAKAEIAKMLTAKISSVIYWEYFQDGVVPEKEYSDSQVAKVAREKMKQLIAENPDTDKKELLGSTAFAQTLESVAACAVSGVQAFFTVESQLVGRQGEIGIVAIWSPATEQMAKSLYNHNAVPLRKKGQSVFKQVPQDKNVLISTFGVQQTIDENGELVLMSYAQSTPRSLSGVEEKAAFSRAALTAEAQIREFAGVSVATSAKLEKAEQNLDMGGAIPAYSNQEAFSTFSKAEGEKMLCPGIVKIKEWSHIHPANETPVCGVVVAWKPTSARKADEMRENSKEAEAAAAGKSAVKKAPQKAQGGNAKKQQDKKKGKKKNLKVKQHVGHGGDGNADAL